MQVQGVRRFISVYHGHQWRNLLKEWATSGKQIFNKSASDGHKGIVYHIRHSYVERHCTDILPDCNSRRCYKSRDDGNCQLKQ